MFRRRRPAREPELEYDESAEWAAEESDEDADIEDERPSQAPRADGGPWDVGEPFPERERVDLGSLWVPVGPGHEVQLVMAEQLGAWVTARYGESELQVQAFAAARNDALWDDVRGEIAAEIQSAGGRSAESDSQFGIALDAEVPAEPGNPEAGLRTVRFVGVDGPRWFLRGLFSGPAAAGGAAAAELLPPAESNTDADVLEDVFRDIVVVRGEHPMPPRDLLELRLPPEAAQAIAEQQAQQASTEGDPEGQGGGGSEESRDWGDVNPFERGPEFTETR